ncbi:hypothetical protein [Synechococcus sp. MVIR-18-1]|uniref:hypothetical protein n=1 Tax=Synechococcus sp. MVIR-18-1 TaxID=1386941 RepID=UPI001645AE09|nr:hypothetical protein [Synechococcus sp. MVIR-18-1]
MLSRSILLAPLEKLTKTGRGIRVTVEQFCTLAQPLKRTRPQGVQADNAGLRVTLDLHFRPFKTTGSRQAHRLTAAIAKQLGAHQTSPPVRDQSISTKSDSSGGVPPAPPTPRSSGLRSQSGSQLIARDKGPVGALLQQDLQGSTP